MTNSLLTRTGMLLALAALVATTALMVSGAGRAKEAGAQVPGVILVPPATLTCTGVIAFDDVAGGPLPGTNYDGVLQSDGAGFAERFSGQI